MMDISFIEHCSSGAALSLLREIIKHHPVELTEDVEEDGTVGEGYEINSTCMGHGEVILMFIEKVKPNEKDKMRSNLQDTILAHMQDCSRTIALDMLREIMDHHPIRFSIQGEEEEYELSGTGIVDDAIHILISPQEDPLSEAIESINSALEDVDCDTTRSALALVLTTEYIEHDKTKEEFLHNMAINWDILNQN
jgi:hypothetical protein